MSKLSSHSVFSIDVRVYYEDTDVGGVVYYANYLKYMERARTDLLRALGCSQSLLFEQERRLFVVRSAALQFAAPARLDDVLEVTAEVAAARRASVRFLQRCIRKNPDGSAEPLVTGDVLIACLNADTFKPCAIPDNLKTVLNS